MIQKLAFLIALSVASAVLFATFRQETQFIMTMHLSL